MQAYAAATAPQARQWETQEENPTTITLERDTEWGASPQKFYEDCRRWEVYGSNLLYLTLHTMGIQDIGPIVTLVLMSRSLIYLDVSSNPEIGDDGATQLAIATSNRQLRILCLADCNITDRGAKQLALHSTVTDLHLQNNQISDTGAKALLENTCFESLALAQNEIGNEGAAEMAPILANKTKSLVHLNLLGNHAINTVLPFVVALEAEGAKSSLRTLILTPNWSIPSTELPLRRRIQRVLLARRELEDERH